MTVIVEECIQSEPEKNNLDSERLGRNTFNVKFSVLEVYPTTPQLQDIVDVYAPDQIDIYSMHIDILTVSNLI